MNERELGRALLKFGAQAREEPPPPDPQVLMNRILQRDRRNIGGWAVVTALAWGMTVACMVSLVCFWNVYITPIVNFLAEHPNVSVPADHWAGMGEVLGSIAIAAVVGLLFAILSTVLLVFASRRATLRQVNASLMQISEQLKQLQRALESQAGRTTVSDAHAN
jgi:hypothetical protein